MDVASFRESLGLSQAEFARELGLRSKGYISKIESRRVTCPLRLALKIERLSKGRVKAVDLVPPEAAELLPPASNQDAAA